MNQRKSADPLTLASEIPDGLDSWLVEFVGEALAETGILFDNGAIPSATARESLLRKLIQCATAYFNQSVGVEEAAATLGISQETVRRRVRDGSLPDERENPRGHIRIKRRELVKVARSRERRYDPIPDAQDVAKLRRSAA